VDPGPLTNDLQLVDRVGTLQVGRHQQRGVALLPQPQRELPGQRRLTRALQAGEHDHRRRTLGEPQLPRLATEDADQFLVDDLDHLLGGVERSGQLGPPGPLLDRGDEVPDHAQVDVCLQQGDPDLAGGRVDVGFGQATLAPQGLEGRRQAVLQGVEHRLVLVEWIGARLSLLVHPL
jgi:hypothetical protein